MDDNSDTLCSKCEQEPCAPKKKGTGLSRWCQKCRDKANASVKKTREQKKQKIAAAVAAESQQDKIDELTRLLNAVHDRLKAVEAKVFVKVNIGGRLQTMTPSRPP